jgi:hypothetical protein
MIKPRLPCIKSFAMLGYPLRSNQSLEQDVQIGLGQSDVSIKAGWALFCGLLYGA